MEICTAKVYMIKGNFKEGKAGKRTNVNNLLPVESDCDVQHELQKKQFFTTLN